MAKNVVLQAGQLRHRITIQTPPADVNNPFTQDLPWVDLITCWARIQPLTTREIYQGTQDGSGVTHRITMRYPGSVGIRAGYKIKFGTRIFELKDGFINVEERNRVIQLSARELNPTE
jgi:SPP1 family predicted phage head-tail adaptor